MTYSGRAGNFKNSQLGFTLVELLMAMLVGGLIMAAATATLQQILSNNNRNTARMMAVKQVENALFFISRDVQMAQAVQTNSLGAGEVLKLGWATWGPTNVEVVYSWSPSDNSLIRRHSVDGVTTTVAYSIYPKPEFSPQPWTGGDLSVTITSTVRGASESRVLHILPRTGT